MPTNDELWDKVKGDVLEEFHAQTVQATASAYAATFPHLEELPPWLSELERRFWREWEERYRPKEAPPPPDYLGPWNADIRFGDAPVGGWSQLTLHRGGAWNLSGHLHDSGAASYDTAVVWAVKDNTTDEVFKFTHTGRVHGTFEPGSRDDDWGESGTNAALDADWASLCSGCTVSWAAGVNVDITSITDGLLKGLGAIATIVSIV